MKRHEDQYLQALQSFSAPARALWKVVWIDEGRYDLELLGDDDAGIIRISLIGDEDTGCGLSRIPVRNIDHHLGDGLVKCSPLQRQYQLISKEIQRYFLQVHGAPGLPPLRQPYGQPEHEQGEEQDRASQSHEAQARCLHCDQFFVEGESSEGGDRGNDSGDWEG